MVSTEVKTFILPFQECDFSSLNYDQYIALLEAAKDRALWQMTADCKQYSDGWGIKQTDLDDDVSGRLQEALELLTASEFLGRYVGLYSVAETLGRIKSPTGLEIERAPEDLDRLMRMKDDLKKQAWIAAYNWVCDDLKTGCTAISVKAYNWLESQSPYRSRNSAESAICQKNYGEF